MSPAPDEVDPRRVRIGLAIVTVVFLTALVLLLAIDDATARLLMAAVVVFSVVRAAWLFRSLRRERG